RMYPPVTLGFVSFRSHAEAFLAQQDPGGRLRAGFDEIYLRRADQLTARVNAVVGCLASDTPEVPFVREWVELLDPFRVRGGPVIRRGGAPMLWRHVEEEESAAERDWVAASPMHTLMRTSDNFVRFMNEHLPVRSYRL